MKKFDEVLALSWGKLDANRSKQIADQLANPGSQASGFVSEIQSLPGPRSLDQTKVPLSIIWASYHRWAVTMMAIWVVLISNPFWYDLIGVSGEEFHRLLIGLIASAFMSSIQLIVKFKQRQVFPLLGIASGLVAYVSCPEVASSEFVAGSLQGGYWPFDISLIVFVSIAFGAIRHRSEHNTSGSGDQRE